MPSKRGESDSESDDLDTFEELELTYYKSINKHPTTCIQQPGPLRKVRNCPFVPRL